MVETPTMPVQAPPSAATRLKPHPISTEMKAQWNREVEALYRGFQNLDNGLFAWGKNVFYGPSEVMKRRESSSTS
jgi:altered-inheritance-of-mitochondria protein 5